VPLAGRSATWAIVTGLPLRGKLKVLRSPHPEFVVGRYYFANDGSIALLYEKMLRGSRRALRAVARVLADPSNYPVLLHCAAGKDRTGIVVALFASLCADPGDAGARERICRDYAASFENLKRARDALAATAELAGVPTDDALLRTPYATMATLLARVDAKYGSVRRFFEVWVGVDAAELDRVVRALGGPSSS